MTYVLTYGPLDDELNVSCETATEALSLLTDLRERGQKYIMVSSYQTGDVAIDVLRVLAEQEGGQDEDG
ncbi:hypothetical protein [Chenggangzhangella methanolivorans]|uniref:Uncharacterized protein n=1 Tax=Chenggangzhangella methanolivorans TaxID=1437009 RepID=A0A9E6RDQ0_9HYPH|nr:hypothetical protein [Chenggangzhangella methanolivorans]QZO01453.1 hypothetical protein K6K41_08450 [Chenggangzhangella methanolivorans]